MGKKLPRVVLLGPAISVNDESCEHLINPWIPACKKVLIGYCVTGCYVHANRCLIIVPEILIFSESCVGGRTVIPLL